MNEILEDVRRCLRRSALELGQMRLYKSSKWSGEALCGLTDFIPNKEGFSDNNDMRSLLNDELDEEKIFKTDLGLDKLVWTSADDYDLFLLAGSLFDCKEFDRCAFFLKDVKTPRLVFMKHYSEYLSWDKKSQEKMESLLITGKLNGNEKSGDDEKHSDVSSRLNADNNFSQSVNMGDGLVTSSSIILNSVNSYLNKFESEDINTVDHLGIALLYYLKGVIEKNENNKTHAISSFLKSLSHYSFNWTCWVELQDCVTRADESVLLIKYLEEKIQLNDSCNLRSQSEVDNNIMIKFFKLILFQEFSGNVDEYIESLEYLVELFPTFSFLKAQNALMNYNYMDYINSEQLFEQIIKLDPYRLDDLDVFSNILYVMQKQTKLSYLAQFSSQIDRFRPETCCIIANYYSARQEHEKSIMYFRRALTLNKKNTSAWTLMGHEFVELKNSQAAIECYRRAVDINKRDFKAWYGLGQAYEVLDMHLYSLYYFQKACTLKPLDKRMWQALANCYTRTGNTQDAIKAYERALQLSLNADQDSNLLYKLAELYEEVQDVKSCKNFMVRCVNIENSNEGLVTDETAKARLWLARFEVKQQNFESAYNYAIGVSHGSSQDIEEARAIARNCRKRLQ